MSPEFIKAATEQSDDLRLRLDKAIGEWGDSYASRGLPVHAAAITHGMAGFVADTLIATMSIGKTRDEATDAFMKSFATFVHVGRHEASSVMVVEIDPNATRN